MLVKGFIKKGEIPVKILNYGSLNLDHVYDVKKFPQPGETIDSMHYETFVGGKGLNQSIALQRSGVPVYHAGCIGKDGWILKETLKNSGVDTRYISECDAKTGHALVQVNEAGENCIILYHGANKSIKQSTIDDVFQDFGEGDILIIQNEINHLPYIIDTAIAKHMMIVFNPAPFTSELQELKIEHFTYIILNESEAKGLANQNTVEEAITRLKDNYHNTNFVITLGAQGCYFFNLDKTIYQEAYKVPVIDTTGAGDTFIGYFIGSITMGNSIEESLRMASKAAAIAITKKGSSNAIPCMDEVMSFKF